MKQETKKFLLDLSRYLTGITDTIRSGDDGFEDNIQAQVKGLQKSITDFIVMHCEKDVEAEQEKSLQPYYVGASERLIDKESMTPAENTIWYKSRLYAFIKRKIREANIDWATKKRDEISIEIQCLIEEEYRSRISSKEWMHSSFQVIDDVVDQIIEKRKGQAKLFA